jgi:hypothetical protein
VLAIRCTFPEAESSSREVSDESVLIRVKIMKNSCLKISAIISGLFLLAPLATAASYDIPVTLSGDQVNYRQWYSGGSDRWSDVNANPNAVFHDYSYGSGSSANSSLSFDLSALQLPAESVLSASFNFNVLEVWTQGRNDIGNFSGGGTVLYSAGSGWKSFDVTDSIQTAFRSNASSASYGLEYTGYSGFTFASAEGGMPAYLRITTPGIAAPVPEPESFAMLLAGLGLMAGIARRKQSK